MAKQIDYLDIDKYRYGSYEIDIEYINEDLKNCKIINVETLKDRIRFWYYKED